VHSDLENLCGQLAAIVGDGHVAAGVANTAAFAVDGILPELIVRPGTQEEVSQVVAACAKAGAAMIPWGGGTAMGWATPRPGPRWCSTWSGWTGWWNGTRPISA